MQTRTAGTSSVDREMHVLWRGPFPGAVVAEADTSRLCWRKKAVAETVNIILAKKKNI